MGYKSRAAAMAALAAEIGATPSVTELPEVTSADEGDVLMVNASGKWAKGSIAAELPEVSGSDNGSVLTVVEGEWAKAAVPTELPAVTADDNGSVLTVAEGAWSAVAPASTGD